MDNNLPGYKQPSNTKKIIIGTALVLGGITAIAIVLAVISSGRDSSTDVSILAAQQSEAVRIASIGIDHDSATPTTRNYAITVHASVVSANQRLREVPGGIPSKSIQAQYTDSTLDTTLANAASINQFNERFADTLETQLKSILDQANVVLAKITNEDDVVIVTAIAEETQILIDSTP